MPQIDPAWKEPAAAAIVVEASSPLLGSATVAILVSADPAADNPLAIAAQYANGAVAF